MKYFLATEILLVLLAQSYYSHLCDPEPSLLVGTEFTSQNIEVVQTYTVHQCQDRCYRKAGCVAFMLEYNSTAVNTKHSCHLINGNDFQMTHNLCDSEKCFISGRLVIFEKCCHDDDHDNNNIINGGHVSHISIVMPAEVPLPKSGPTAQICVWADFTLKDIDELSWLHEPDKIKGKISEVLGINVIESSIKKDILCYLSLLWAFKDSPFTPQPDSPFGNVDAAYEYFKELLVRHCMKRPPFCVQLYSMAEAKSITDYVLNTYFKHYKLYKYAFTPKVRLNLTFEYNGLPEEPAEIEGEKEEPEGGANVEITVEGDSGIAEPEQMENEDPPAVKELKTIINSTLSDQVQKLKMNMDEQLKTNEETLLKKISAAAGTERGPSRKSRKK
eukprot:gene15185-6381_t